MRSSAPRSNLIFSLVLHILITFAFSALPSTEARALIPTNQRKLGWGNGGSLESGLSPFTVEVDRNQSLCNFNPLLDTGTYYCGYYSELKIPLYDNEYNWQKKVLEQEVTLKTSLVYQTVFNVDNLGAIEKGLTMELSFENAEPGANFLRQVTNITSGSNLAARSYYWAVCADGEQQQQQSKYEPDDLVDRTAGDVEECSRIWIHGLDYYTLFGSKLIVMVSDSRLAERARDFYKAPINKSGLDYFRLQPLTINMKLLRPRTKQQSSALDSENEPDSIGLRLLKTASPIVVKEASWVLEPEKLLLALEDLPGLYSQYVYYGNLLCAALSVNCFFLVLFRRGMCYCCHMTSRIMHVELKEKLRKKEMKAGFDFIDMFMYNHNAAKQFDLRLKRAKLKAKLEQLGAELVEPESPRVVEGDLENEPLFSEQERRRLTGVRDKLVAELQIVEYKVNIHVKCKIPLKAAIQEYIEVENLINGKDIPEIADYERSDDGFGAVPDIPNEIPPILKNEDEDALFDGSDSGFNVANQPQAQSKRLFIDRNNYFISESEFGESNAEVADEINERTLVEDAQYPQLESLGKDQKIEEYRTRSGDPTAQMRTKIKDYVRDYINNSVLLKGENYKSQYTMPPIIRDSDQQLTKRYNSEDDDRSSVSFVECDCQKQRDLFSGRDDYERQDLFDWTQPNINLDHAFEGLPPKSRRSRRDGRWQHYELETPSYDCCTRHINDNSLNLSYLNEELTRKLGNNQPTAVRPQRTRAKMPAPIGLSRDQRADIADAIVEHGNLSKFNIQPEYMVELLDAHEMSNWILEKREKDRFDRYDRTSRVSRVSYGRRSEKRHLRQALGYQSQSGDSEDSSVAYVGPNLGRNGGLQFQLSQQKLATYQQKHNGHIRLGQYGSRNDITPGLLSATGIQYVEKERNHSLIDIPVSASQRQPNRQTGFLRGNSAHEIKTAREIQIRPKAESDIDGTSIQRLAQRRRSYIKMGQKQELPSAQHLSLDRTSGVLNQSQGDQFHSISKVLHSKSRVKKELERRQSAVSGGQSRLKSFADAGSVGRVQAPGFEDEQESNVFESGANLDGAEHENAQMHSPIKSSKFQFQQRVSSPKVEYRSPRWEQRTEQLSKRLAGRRSSPFSNGTKTFTFQMTSPQSKRLTAMVPAHTRGTSAAESAATGRIVSLKSPYKLGKLAQRQAAISLVRPQELISHATPHNGHHSDSLQPSDVYSAQALHSKPSMQLLSGAKPTAVTSTSKQTTISKRLAPHQGLIKMNKRVNFELTEEHDVNDEEQPQRRGPGVMQQVQEYADSERFLLAATR